MHEVKVGCAGWSLPRRHAESFPAEGTHLQRYAARFPAVEVNSSFYRPHRAATWARWGSCVPEGFRFAAKVPKEVTHVRRFVDVDEPLDRYLAEVAHLGERLGPLLVQLPPSFQLDTALADGFFSGLRARFAGDVVCEPRHPTWFAGEADALLVAHRVARVAADPAPVPEAAEPGGWRGLAYWRLHGSPRMYWSAYEPDYLRALSRRLLRDATPAWVIFDNTAMDAATGDALALLDLLREGDTA